MANEGQQLHEPLDPATDQIIKNHATGASANVTSIVAGAGISISGPTGNVTISASGVTSIIPGTNITVSGSGAITVNATVTDASISLSNVTTNDVSTTKHGFAPVLPNDATKYLDGTGAYSIPVGSGGSVSSVTGTDTLTASTPISTTHTITHGLGKTPVIVMITTASILETPVPSGTGTTWDGGRTWMYLDSTGTPVGGLTATYHIIAGGGGSTTLTGISMQPTSVGATGSTSGGTGTASITVNNFTSTTFDIVYAATQSSGSFSFTFPTVTWIVIG